MERLLIKTLDGFEMPADLAQPQAGGGPGLILVHDQDGPTPATLAWAQALAEAGFITLCPHYLTRAPFDLDACVRDLLAALAFLRKGRGCSGKVGTLGVGLGGLATFLFAARSDVDCVAAFDGAGIEAHLDEVYDIRMPFQLHFGTGALSERGKASLARNKVLECCFHESETPVSSDQSAKDMAAAFLSGRLMS